MKKTKKNKNPIKNSSEMIELNKTMPRAQEEQFLFQFSTTHHNAVLLIVLCATFIVQGVLRYLETMDKMNFVRPWFIIVILSLIFLITSVVTVIFSNVLSPLKTKRELSVLSFVLFVLGFMLFFTSLAFLLFII